MHVRIQCAFEKIIIVDIPQTSKREANQKYTTTILMTQDIRNYNHGVKYTFDYRG